MKYKAAFFILIASLGWSAHLVHAQSTFEQFYGSSDWHEVITDSEEDLLGNYYLTG